MGWLSILALLGAISANPSGPPAGLTDVLALTSDPPPTGITNDTHYLVSNERRLDLFASSIEPRGGVYVGVGAGQNYVLAGWARPEYMVLVDFDQDVVDLHHLYAMFLAYAPDAKAFEDLWSDSGSAQVHRWLPVAVRNDARATRLLALYDRARPEVAERIRIMHGKLAEAGEDWYLTDAEAYDHLADLARRDRIVAKRGDFTQPGVLRELGDALRAASASVGVLYLSNIEQYFMYGKDYRANVLGLPLDRHTAVLRTLPGRPAGFEYITQRGDQLHAWMRRKRTTSVYRVRGLVRGTHLQAGERFVAGGPPT